MENQRIEKMDSDAILACLRKHLNEQRPVLLYNVYHGIPITYEAEVAMIHPDFIGLVVHPYQAVCIKEDRCTFIESKLVPGLVCASPVFIDYTNHVVLFKHLRITAEIPFDLYHSWVTPENPVRVDIGSDHAKDLTSEIGKLAMLNDNWVRVVVDVPEGSPYALQDTIDLTFRLEEDGDLIQVQGVVKAIVRDESQQDDKWLEVEGRATMGDEISILAFIAKREDAVMGALYKVYKKLRKRKNKK